MQGRTGEEARGGPPRSAPTLKDVAQHAGVSRATVSLVLRNSPLVAPATRTRVEASLGEVGYVYNRSAARLRSGTSGTVGLVVPEITNPFYAELTAGLDEILDAEGRVTFLANSNERTERQERFIQRMREQRADGIVLCAAEGTSGEALERVAQARIACVQILRTVDGPPFDFVGPDFGAGVELALAHLGRRGHGRVALLPSLKKTSAACDRVDAYRRWIGRHRAGPPCILPCGPTRDEADRVLDVLSSGDDPPSAVVCHNDLIALAVHRALLRRGITPGERFGIVGFDDVPDAAASVPGLTTVATRPTKVGACAARLLLRRIADPDAPPERILVAPELVVRDT